MKEYSSELSSKALPGRTSNPSVVGSIPTRGAMLMHLISLSLPMTLRATAYILIAWLCCHVMMAEEANQTPEPVAQDLPAAESSVSVEESLLSAEERLLAARKAGDSLVAHLKSNGQFIYRFDVKRNLERNDYNMLRHSGTIYALCQLYEATQHEAYRETAIKAAEFLLTQVRTVPININGEARELTVVVSDNEINGRRQSNLIVKAGGAALGLVALLYTDHIRGTTTYQTQAQALGQFLVAIQMPSGNILSKYDVDREKWSEWQSDYYPGEALVALGLLQRTYPHAEVEDAIHKLMIYLANRWHLENESGGKRIKACDHWSLIALEMCWPHFKDEKLAPLTSPGKDVWTRDRLLKEAIHYCRDELNFLVKEGEQTGALGTGNLGIAANSTRLEGIQAVKRTARLATPDLLSEWEQSISSCLRFIIRGQFTAVDQDLYNTSIPIAGSFKRDALMRNLRSLEIRIDYAQHAISALLNPSPPKPNKLPSQDVLPTQPTE